MSSVVFRIESGIDLQERIDSIGTLYHDKKGNLLSKQETAKKYSRNSIRRKSQSHPPEAKERSKSKSYSIERSSQPKENRQKKCVPVKEGKNRKELIKEILEMEKTKQEIEKSRQKMATERSELYKKFEEISNFHSQALKSNCYLKKKIENRKFEFEIDQFLHFRNGKNENKLKDELGLQNLHNEFHKNLLNSINEMKNNHKKEIKNISILNKGMTSNSEKMSKIDMRQKRLHLEDHSYKVGNAARQSFLIERQLMEKIKNRENDLKNNLDFKKMKFELEKKLDLTRNCYQNMKSFQKTVEIYRNIYTTNFNRILTFSVQLNKLKDEEMRKKLVLVRLKNEFEEMNSKYLNYKNNIWDLKRFVYGSSKMRKRLKEEIARQKRLKVQKQVEIIKKELLDKKLDTINVKSEKMNKEINADFLRMKKRFYKELVKGAEMLKMGYLRDYYFKEVLDEKYNLPYEMEAAKSTTFADYENEMRVTVHNEPPDRASSDFSRFGALLTLRYLEEKIKANSLHSTDLGLDSDLLNNFVKKNANVKSETCL